MFLTGCGSAGPGWGNGKSIAVLFARQGARIFGVDNRRQTVRFGPEVAFAQIGIIGFDRQIELEALRLYGLPEDAPAVLSGCPALPTGGGTLMFSASWDLPSMPPGATTNADVTVVGARQGDFAGSSLDTTSIAFVLDCHASSNDKVRVTARNVSLSTVELPAGHFMLSQ